MDEWLHKVLQKAMESGMTLNEDKCTFCSKEVKLLGQILSNRGISSNPDKIATILDISKPTNIPELRQFLWIVNRLAKFTHNLSKETKLPCNLLSKKNHWHWGGPQKESFSRVEKQSADASSLWSRCSTQTTSITSTK